MKEMCTDVIVLLDGNNGGFHSYMKTTEAERIGTQGLQNAQHVILTELPDRPIPNTLKDGTALIKDVLVKIQPTIGIYKN